MESTFHGHAPQPGERIAVGVVDPSTGGFNAVATTAAWNFTQGAMIEWCPQSPNDEILFNDTVDGEPVGVRLNVLTGARQLYLRPFESAGGEGARVASLTPGRIARLHPGGGIAGVRDPFSDDPAPENDGIFLIGLTSGLSRLVLPISAVAAHACARHPKLRRREFWIESVSFNRGGTRMIFTVCAGGESARTDAALYTAAMDGSELREIVSFGRGLKNGAWLDASRCVAVHRPGGGIAIPYIHEDSTGADGEPVECRVS